MLVKEILQILQKSPINDYALIYSTEGEKRMNERLTKSQIESSAPKKANTTGPLMRGAETAFILFHFRGAGNETARHNQEETGWSI